MWRGLVGVLPGLGRPASGPGRLGRGGLGQPARVLRHLEDVQLRAHDAVAHLEHHESVSSGEEIEYSILGSFGP